MLNPVETITKFFSDKLAFLNLRDRSTSDEQEAAHLSDLVKACCDAIRAGIIGGTESEIGSWAQMRGVNEEDSYGFVQTILNNVYGDDSMTPEEIKQAIAAGIEQGLGAIRSEIDEIKTGLTTGLTGVDAVIKSYQADADKLKAIEAELQEFKKSNPGTTPATTPAGDPPAATEPAATPAAATPPATPATEPAATTVQPTGDAAATSGAATTTSDEIAILKSKIAELEKQPGVVRAPVTVQNGAAQRAQGTTGKTRDEIHSIIMKGINDRKLSVNDIQSFEVNGHITQDAASYMEKLAS